MSSISPSEHQRFKEYISPFQPIGRVFYGADLRGTQCDRRGNGNLRLVGYGDSSGGYAFSPDNQDAAIAPSLLSANLSNISNAIPRYTEQQDMAGKWIDTITLHALDEFVEQVEPQSFAPNTFRIFAGGQKGYRGDGTGRPNVRNTYTLLAEVPVPALSRADIPRSFSIKLGVYIPPAQNIYLGLAIPQPYTCSFEMWDLQANTLVGDGISSSLGGAPTVGVGNELSDSDPNPPVDTQFVLPIRFATATWRLGSGAIGQFPQPLPPPPSTVPPLGGGKPIIGGGGGGGGGSPSDDDDPSQPPTGGGSSPPAPSRNPQKAGTPPTGCVEPVQGCEWYQAPKKSFSPPDVIQPQDILSDGTVINVGPPVEVPASSSVGGSPNICPKGTIDRGFVQFASEEFAYVLCCTPATYPPNGLGCTYPDKWSCSAGGVCIPDALGVYNSQAECEAALVPPTFTGGQCVGIRYGIEYKLVSAIDGRLAYQIGAGSPSNNSPTPYSDSDIIGSATAYGRNGSIGGAVTLTPAPFGRFNIILDGVDTGLDAGFPLEPAPLVSINRVVRVDGLADNCGNAPSQCP